MSFASFDAHSNELFIELGLLKVRDLISLDQLKLVFDFHMKRLPSDLMSLFQLSSDVHTQTRELNSTVNKLLYIPKVKSSTYGLDSIRYQCAKFWNTKFKSGTIQVDEEKANNINVHKIKSRNGFKNVLKKHFLHSYTIEPETIYY